MIIRVPAMSRILHHIQLKLQLKHHWLNVEWDVWYSGYPNDHGDDGSGLPHLYDQSDKSMQFFLVIWKKCTYCTGPSDTAGYSSRGQQKSATVLHHSFSDTLPFNHIWHFGEKHCTGRNGSSLSSKGRRCFTAVKVFCCISFRLSILLGKEKESCGKKV